MTPARLLAIFDRVADSPDAVSRLRRFVRDLAVRGRLAEQDPADEPASELLKRIAKVNEQLRVKHQMVPLAEEEVPFHLPPGWHWSRIGELCTKTGSGSTPRGGKNVYSKIGIPFFRSQNVYDGGLRLDDVAYIDYDIHARMAGTTVQARDLLLNITGGSMGRCCRIPDEFGEGNISQHVAIIRPTISKMTDYLHTLVLSTYFQAFIFNEQTGAGRGGLPKHKMDRIAVAVPPLSEQHRIVAKVKELMTLCDQLEETCTKREKTRDHLTEASHAHLNIPDTNEETFEANARFVINILPQLSVHADQVKHLRQTILNLAVRGRLVEQNPAEEPATKLLERIEVERAEALSTKKWNPSRIDTGAFGEDLFALPTGWKWVQLAEISDVSMGQSPPGDTYNKVGNGVPLINGPAEFTPAPFGRTIVNQFTAAPTKFCEEGDLLICVRGSTTGRTNVAGYRACIGRGVAAIRSSFDDEFIRLFLWKARDDIIAIGRGIAFPSISKKQLESLAIPLPPLAEQHRIVAKVNELMELCDRLERSLNKTAIGKQRLLESMHKNALLPNSIL